MADDLSHKSYSVSTHVSGEEERFQCDFKTDRSSQ